MKDQYDKESIIYCCKECENMDNIKKPDNLVSDGVWECPKCGHPHSKDEFMEYVE